MSRRSVLGSMLLALVTLGHPLAASPPQDEETILGKRSAFDLTQEPELVELPAGARLREQPSLNAPVFEILPVAVTVPVLERRGSWVKVHYRSWQAWAVPSGEELTAGFELPDAFQPDEERLLEARRRLGQRGRVASLGPFTLYTDIEEGALLEQLDAVATNLIDTYRQRFGLEPGTEFAEAVVLFALEDDYREQEASEESIADLHSKGFASVGITFIFAGEQSSDEVVQLLIHELTHLLNRRALGIWTPAWLEEGLAEDLAYHKVDAAGRIRLGTLGGSSSMQENPLGRGGSVTRFHATGPRGALFALLKAWDQPQRLALDLLPELTWKEFVQSDDRSLWYAESAFLVRFLLDSKQGDLAARFRDYLNALATSRSPASESLWLFMELSGASLEPGFRNWLVNQAQANGVVLPPS